MEFTEARVKAFKYPPGKGGSHMEWDDNLAGFGFRMQSAHGGKIYYVKYRIAGQQRWLKIGAADKIPLARAQAIAKAHFSSVAGGADPAIAKAQAAVEAGQTFELAIDGYLAKLAKERSALYHWQADMYLRRQFGVLHKKPLAGIDRIMVSNAVDVITKERGPITANRAAATLSAFFNYAARKGMLPMGQNPAYKIDKNKEEPRNRQLSHRELKAIWHKAPQTQFGDIVRLLMLTMQRRTEIGGLLAREFNRKERQIELDGDRVKNGNDSTIPLCDIAFNLIDKHYNKDRKFIFGVMDTGYSGWSKSKAELDAKLGINKAWTLHDFRHTGKTAMEQDLDPPVADNVSEAILNHAKKGLAKVYNGATYVKQKRDALDRYAAHLMEIVH